MIFNVEKRVGVIKNGKIFFRFSKFKIQSYNISFFFFFQILL